MLLRGGRALGGRRLVVDVGFGLALEVLSFRGIREVGRRAGVAGVHLVAVRPSLGRRSGSTVSSRGGPCPPQPGRQLGVLLDGAHPDRSVQPDPVDCAGLVELLGPSKVGGGLTPGGGVVRCLLVRLVAIVAGLTGRCP